MKHKFQIRNSAVRDRVIQYIRDLPLDPVHSVTIAEIKDTRTRKQNDKMWAMLTDISKQVVWYGRKLIPEEWKDVISAGIKKQEAVPGIDGGFVILGARTSKMSIKEMIDVITVAYAFGIDHNVKWSEPDPK